MRHRIYRNDARINPALSGWLDLLRGLAALAVMFGHISEVLFGPGVGERQHGIFRFLARLTGWITQSSHSAVIIFFVLSGYLVGGSYFIRIRNGRGDLREYAAARLSRMYCVVIPALLLTLIFDLIGMNWLGEASFVLSRPEFFHGRDVWQTLTPQTFVCNAAFVQMIWCKQLGTNASLWSLSNEALYYFVWPCLLLARRNWQYALLALLAVPLVLSSELTPLTAGRSLSYLVYFLIWAAGAFCFATKSVNRYAAFGLAALFAMGWCVLHIDPLLADLIAAGAAISLLKGLQDAAPSLRGFRKPAFALAEISFSLYAIHMPIIVMTLLLLGWTAPVVMSQASILAFYAVSGICILSAAMFWWLFERNTKHLKRRLLDIMRPRPPAATATAS